MNSDMITVREAASFLRISLPTVYKMIRAGMIPHVKIGHRYIIPRGQFLSWLNGNIYGGNANE